MYCFMYCFMFCFHLHPIPSHIARLPHFLGVFCHLDTTDYYCHDCHVITRMLEDHVLCNTFALPQPTFSKVLQYVDTGLYAAHQYSFTVAAVSTQGTGNCSPQLAPKPSQNTESNFDWKWADKLRENEHACARHGKHGRAVVSGLEKELP